MGHYARECPTPKGKGKGGKGGGKAGGKGKSGGKGGEYNGKGKGIVGECWTCGQKGHWASECPNRRVAVEIGSVEEDEMTVGGVWQIAQVKVRSEGEVKENKGEDTKKEECEKEVKSDEWEHMKTVEVTCKRRSRKMNRFTKAKTHEVEVKVEKLQSTSAE